MNFSQHYFTIIFFLLYPGWVDCVVAQTNPDTLVRLSEITIQDAPGSRYGYSVYELDTLPFATPLNLAERLLFEMPLDIRANAPGALATLSARGAGPARTAVFWEGQNLQSPMNGVVDAALLPVWAGDRIEIQYGGQSAANSSGAMGGTLRILPAKQSDSAGWQYQAGIGTGSFGRLDGQATLGYKGQKHQNLLRLAWHQAENNFPFKNSALLGMPEVRQVNNETERFDLQYYSQLVFSKKNTLNVAAWFQRAFREIPPSMTEAPTLSWQNDRALRLVATWNHEAGEKTKWQHRLAYLDETIHFNLGGVIDSSHSKTLAHTTEFFQDFGGKISLRTRLNGWMQFASADGYIDSTQWFRQGRLAATILGEYHWRRLQVHVQIRQEWAENQAWAFTWSVGGRFAVLKHTYLHGHISRNFNLPTFNDRFWRSLGNPELQPESGYSAELGLRRETPRYLAEATVFHLLLDDWILWQPGADGLFRPGNLRKVWSRGISLAGHYRFHFWRSQWKLNGRYQFVRVTNTAVYGGSTSALHKVLPYSPQQTLSVSFAWNAGPWDVRYLHQWTGGRFTASDNSVQLPGFQTGNLLIQYKLPLGRHHLYLSSRLENCWNTAYQIIAFRPMPGRTWHAGMSWNF